MDTSNITGIKIWGTDVEKLYIGSELVWEKEEPETETEIETETET